MVLKRSTVPPISGKLNSTNQNKHATKWTNQTQRKMRQPRDSTTCATEAREKDGAGKKGGSECGKEW